MAREHTKVSVLRPDGEILATPIMLILQEVRSLALRGSTSYVADRKPAEEQP